MSVVFGDTYYFVGFLNKQDHAHEIAVKFAAAFRGNILTTESILVEVADALASTRQRAAVAQYVQQLWVAPRVDVIPFSTSLMRAGLVLYESRSDKNWSLTDCISFVVMREHGLTDALTGDHHFAQAGFNALLKT